MSTIQQFKTLFAVVIVFFSVSTAIAQAPPIEWQVALGGTEYDLPATIRQTADGGYIVSGYSSSTDGDFTGSNNFGGTDFGIVKLNAAGSIVWIQKYGSTRDEITPFSSSIQQTTDGGYVVVGSNGPPFTENYWVLKLDAAGTTLWDKTLGGNAHDYGTSIQQTADGGYIVAGYTNSSDLGIHGGLDDIYLVKLDATGQITQWTKVLGGFSNDIATVIRQTADGGYIVGGYTESNDGDVSGNHGGYDGWLVKLDATGTNILWQKTYGGTDDDFIFSLQQTAEGGYIAAGYTASNNGDVSGNHGGTDAWVLKLDSAGGIEWQKCFGGTNEDEANEISQTNDGGYIVACVKTNTGSGMDSWTLKLDGSGNIEWEKTLSGSNTDENYSGQKTSDNGYILLMSTASTNGDFTGAHGSNDYYVVKLLGDTATGNGGDTTAACISWNLLSDSLVSSASGNITGQPEIVGAGSGNPMSVLGYNTNGQELWSGFNGWVQGSLDIGRYVQFDATPASGNGFTVNSVSFDYSDFQNGIDLNTIGFRVGYSLDHWSTVNFIGQGTYLGTAVQPFTASSLGVVVPNGATFSLRIFPYGLQDQQAGSPTRATHKNVTICGETYPSSGCAYYDTIFTQVYDTVRVYDTITTHITDTSYVTVYDTVTTTVFDTITTYVSVTDTLKFPVRITGAAGITDNYFTVYPNPAHNHLVIDNGNYPIMSGYSIKITNMLGQVVFNQPINQQQFNIDLSTWGGAGNYVLSVIDPNQNVAESKTIVLQ